MSEFLPVSDAKMQELSDRLSKTMFKNPEFFVEMYNSGLINKKHSEVSQIATELVSTFKNVREQNYSFVFLSRQEVYLNELMEVLDERSTEVHIKREVDSLVSNGVVSPESIVAFSEESVGYLFSVARNEENGITLTKVGSNKLFSKSDQVRKVYDRVSSIRNDDQAEQNVFFFRVSDLAGVDVGWIDRMHELIPTD